MDFILSLGVFGWSLVFITVTCAIACFTRRQPGRAEAKAKIHQGKSTLTTPPPVGGGIGGNL